jgi:hypothetical protein
MSRGRSIDMETTTTIDYSSITPTPESLPGTNGAVDVVDAGTFFFGAFFILVMTIVVLIALRRVYTKRHLAELERPSYPIMRTGMWAVFGVSAFLFCCDVVFWYCVSWFFEPGEVVEG